MKALRDRWGMDSGSPAEIVAISSHVVRGAVGNRAIVFALETMGFRVWSLPTVILPWHPGHGPATRIFPDAEKFTAFMKDLERAPWLGEVAAVLSGYLGDARQAADVAALVRRVKAGNPDAHYVCDPVMGDRGGLYVPEATAEAMRDILLPLADVATPNRYELAWIVGRKLDDLPDLVRAAREMAPRRMLVTSAPGTTQGRIGNLLVTPDEELLAEHGEVDQHLPVGRDEGQESGRGFPTRGVTEGRLERDREAIHALLDRGAAVEKLA